MMVLNGEEENKVDRLLFKNSLASLKVTAIKKMNQPNKVIINDFEIEESPDVPEKTFRSLPIYKEWYVKIDEINAIYMPTYK